MGYEEFRAAIQVELKKNPDGLTWTELKQKLRLTQKVPNNQWVNRMEKDIGLMRVREVNRIIWKLK